MNAIRKKVLKLLIIMIAPCFICSCATMATTSDAGCVFHANAQVSCEQKVLSGVTVQIYFFPTSKKPETILKAAGKNDQNGLFTYNMPHDCSASTDFIMTFSKTGYKTVWFRGNGKEDIIHQVNMERE
jgi:hypothetical protein